jgi:SPP1 family predicted phage head-tail adaptor
MLAQRLRHRVRLQEQVQTQNPVHGGVELSWNDLDAELPAEVVPLSGREYIQAQTNLVEVTARITIRWRADVDPSMRIVFGGIVYAITAVLPDPTDRRWLTLMVRNLEPSVESGT